VGTDRSGVRIRARARMAWHRDQKKVRMETVQIHIESDTDNTFATFLLEYGYRFECSRI
jgi:hypothetical protein